MANLYRKPITITDPKTGERVKAKAKKWWGRFKDENGIERRVPLAIDKTAAQAMLNELVKKTERLASGVIDKFDEERKRPLAEHLREFEKHLRAKRVSNEQVKLVIYRAKKIIDKCKAKMATDLKASRVQSFLADLRDQGASIQTSNHYLRAIKQLTRWMVKDRRSHDDPLQFVSMLNVSTDRRHDRRPLTEAEFTAILNAARGGRSAFRMAGPDRAMLYVVAAYTGLRASELASLSDVEPWRHQVTELPPIQPQITEYQRHRLRCSCCGVTTCGTLPEGVPSGMTGPRLTALVGLLMALFRQSKRRVSLFCETALGVTVSPGLVVKLQNLVTESTRPAYDELVQSLPQLAAVNVDETPTRQQNRNAWIWTVVSKTCTVFAVRLTKAATVINELLGPDFMGVVTSDRAKMYEGRISRRLTKSP